MSRAYRIAIEESIREHVKVDDGFETGLELLPILPTGRTADLLAAELEKQGFQREGNKAKRTDDDGTEITVDLEQGKVSVRLAEEADVEIKGEDTYNTYDDAPDRTEGEKRARDRLKKDLQGQVEKKKEELTAELTKKLKDKMHDLQQELDQAVSRTTSAALKEKAAQLGEIQEISEDQATGTMTIKVRV